MEAPGPHWEGIDRLESLSYGLGVGVDGCGEKRWTMIASFPTVLRSLSPGRLPLAADARPALYLVGCALFVHSVEESIRFIPVVVRRRIFVSRRRWADPLGRPSGASGYLVARSRRVGRRAKRPHFPTPYDDDDIFTSGDDIES